MSKLKSHSTMDNIDESSRKGQIAHAAMEIIGEEGFSNLVMVRIADRLHITDAALYKHFKSKTDMLLYMMELVERSLMRNIVANISPGVRGLPKLKELLEIQLEFIENNRAFPRIMFSGAIQFEAPSLVKRVNDVVKGYAGIIEGVLRELSDEGAIAKGIHIESAATVFIGLIQAAYLKWVAADYNYSLSDQGEGLWLIFVNGII